MESATLGREGKEFVTQSNKEKLSQYVFWIPHPRLKPAHI